MATSLFAMSVQPGGDPGEGGLEARSDRRQGAEGRHVPALDGLRAVAVAAVVAYHLDPSALPGGYLGVDVFFVLSGYLITGLLVRERASTGRVRFTAFWARRARRLLPGLFLLLASLCVVSVLLPEVVNASLLRSDGLAALFYVANWHFLAVNQTYFGQIGIPSPLEHTWTLAIEEQFYVVWPPVLIGMYWLAARLRPGRNTPRQLLAPVSLAAAASIAAMALAYDGGKGLETAYFSTQCRAFELLIGALAALALASRRPQPAHRHPRVPPAVLGAIAGAAALSGVGVAFALARPGAFIFDGGLALVAVASALVVVSCLVPGPVSQLLALRPLRFIGRISYEIYLWHWPVIVVVDGEWHPSGATRIVCEVGLSVVLAWLSHILVGAPVRRASFRSAIAKLALPASIAVTATLLAATVPIDAASAAPEAAGSLGRVSGALASAHASSAERALVDTAYRPPHPGPVTVFGVRLPAPTGTLDLGYWPQTSQPVRIMYIGDSVMYQTELAVGAALGSTGDAVTAANGAILGWSPEGGHDFARLGREIAHSHPDVIVAMWSQDNTWIATHGTAAYETDILDPLLKLLLKPGNGVKGVIFAAEPAQPPPDSWMPDVHANVYNPKGKAMWQATMRAEARLHPGRIAFVPATQMLELSGAYSTWLPSPGGTIERVRQVDDFHLCLNGGVRYGAGIAAGVAGLLGLPQPEPNWWLGPYAKAQRWYQLPKFPPGQCPDDAPASLPGTPGGSG